MITVKQMKRPRGRPPVPTKFDEKLMADLADELIAHPSTPLAAAIKKLRPEGEKASDDTFIRRVRRHWNDNRDDLLAEAKARLTAAKERPRTPLAGVARGFHAASGACGQSSEAFAHMQRIDLPSISALQEFSAAMRAASGAFPVTSFSEELAVAREQLDTAASRQQASAQYSASAAREEAERQALGAACREIAQEGERVRRANPLSGTIYDPTTASGQALQATLKQLQDLKRRGLL